MTHFSSSKNRLTIFLLWGLALALACLLFLTIKNDQMAFLPITLTSIVILIIVWILLDTRYVIKNNDLLYRSGPFRGRIDILKINKIKEYSGYNTPVTMKPALNYKGFIITYNNHQEVFVSPKNHSIFIDELLKINDKILTN